VARIALIAIWVAAAGMAGVLALLAYELSRRPPPAPQATSIEQMPRRQRHNTWARWSVTEHLAAHHVLIAHVETRFLHEAVAIARQVTEPVKDRYAEVLIYFHRPGRPDVLPPRRVQWTAKTGYVEIVYD
jgi:hypothetical protein